MIFNCHCSRCRKSHGSAFATQVIADRESLKFLRGQDFLSEFESTSAVRAFCSHCGSRLMNYGKNGDDYLSIAITSFDSESDFRPIGECFVGEKLDFIKLDPTIAHFQQLPSILPQPR